MGFPIDIFTLTQIFKISKKKTNSKIFSLATSFTAYSILGSLMFMLTKYLWSDCINCFSDKINIDFLESYCWSHNTYSIMEAFNKSVGKEVIYPGIDISWNKTVKYHGYYQWTPIILLIQAILFYTPRWLWKSWEGGKIESLMMDLNIGICSENKIPEKIKILVDYLWNNFRLHNWWAFKYFICEILALINIIGQMFLINAFFDGAFLSFGIKILKFLDSNEEDRIDPIIQTFPKMTKCSFYKYGVSGEIERHDAICILPLNVVNEKIYIFMWFWLITLATLMIISILYRMITIASHHMRVCILMMHFPLLEEKDLKLVMSRSKFGDWFLFYMLGINLHSIIFRDVIRDLANKILPKENNVKNYNIYLPHV